MKWLTLFLKVLSMLATLNGYTPASTAVSQTPAPATEEIPAPTEISLSETEQRYRTIIEAYRT